MKKTLIYLAKLIVLIGLLALMVWLSFWGIIYLIFLQPLPDALLFALIIALIGIELFVYIKLAVKISRFKADSPEKNEPFFKKAKAPLALIIPAAIVVTLIGTHDMWSHELEKARAKSAVKRADEIVTYGSDTRYNILGTGFDRSAALIDYSDMSVTFVYSISWDEYYKVKLRKGDTYPKNELPEDNIQYRAELKGKGKYFYSYHEKSANDYWGYRRTEGIGIEMADGSFWYAPVEENNLDFNGISARITDAINKAEIIIPYGAVPMPAYAMGLEYDTILVDTDEMAAYVVCIDRDRDRAYIYDDLQFEKVSEDTHPIKQRTYYTDGYTLYGYCDREPDQYSRDRSDGIILITPQGDIYDCHNFGYYNFLQVNYS